MRRAASTFLILTFAASSWAQGLGAAAEKERKRREALRTQEWQEFRNPGGDFKVLFPYPPMRKREAMPGLATMRDTFVAVKEQRSFLVRVGEAPAGGIPREKVPEILDGLREILVKEAKGEVLEEKPVMLGAHPGREIRIKTTQGGEELLLRSRYCVTSDRIFMILSAALASAPDAAATEKFFTSFEILR